MKPLLFPVLNDLRILRVLNTIENNINQKESRSKDTTLTRCFFPGYAHSFRYAGDFVDETPRNDKLNIVRNHIIGIDAVVNAGGFEFQFRDSKLYRDINKAYCAFRDLKEDDGNIDDKLPIVSTGK